MIELPIIQGTVTGIPIKYYRQTVNDAIWKNMPNITEVVKKTNPEKKLLDEYVETYKSFRFQIGYVIGWLHYMKRIPVKEVVKVHNFDYDGYILDTEIGKRSLDEDVSDYPYMFPFKDDKESMILLNHLYRLENISNGLFP